VVDKTGHVEQATAMSGSDLLRPAAVEAVRQWTYRPYLLNGQPTEVETTVTVNFNISR
jgi:protein TonB